MEKGGRHVACGMGGMEGRWEGCQGCERGLTGSSDAMNLDGE